MALSEAKIKELVKASENPVLEDNRKQQVSHKVHITGENYDNILTQIIGYENVDQFKQKKLLTKPFTRPLTKYIIDAQGRWKTAQGTSKYYKFKGEKTEAAKEFEDTVLSQVWRGGSMKDFIKSFLSTAIYTEFNGFFVIEKGKIEVIKGVKYETREGKTKVVTNDYEPKPYIIFKSATDVHNFSVTGKKVDWLIYKLPDVEFSGVKKEVFRVIDDKYDYIVYKEGVDNITIDEVILEHKVGVTPVVPVSFLNKEPVDDSKRASPIDALLPLLDYFLNQYGEHVVSCLLHAHPIYYQVGQQCSYENGYTKCDAGRLNWEENGVPHNIECNSCKGLGHNLRKDASTVIILPAKTETGEPFNITNVAGYATPPIDILKHQMEELDAIKQEILEAATGQIGSQNLNERTATESVLNLKPLEDIIGGIIDIIEGIEKELTDIIGKMYYKEKYIGCEIIYGRKLNLRDENAIIAEIKSAKENGASYYYVKTLVEELIYSRFSSSATDLQRNILIAELEPYVGFTFKEIEDSKNISVINKNIKQNFNEYLQLFEIEEGDILEYLKGSDNRKRIQAIKEKLKQYATEDMQGVETVTKIENENSEINQDNSGQI